MVALTGSTVSLTLNYIHFDGKTPEIRHVMSLFPLKVTKKVVIYPLKLTQRVPHGRPKGAGNFGVRITEVRVYSMP